MGIRFHTKHCPVRRRIDTRPDRVVLVTNISVDMLEVDKTGSPYTGVVFHVIDGRRVDENVRSVRCPEIREARQDSSVEGSDAVLPLQIESRREG